MLKVTFKLMNQKEAEMIAKWQYDGEYAFYNAESDAEDLAELLSPEQRGYHYYSAYEDETLIGFFTFFYDSTSRMTEVGLGLSPNLTGKGLGNAFIEQGLAFGIKTFPGTATFKLSVAAFNKRALRVYERIGFRPIRKSFVETNGGIYRFIHMEKSIGA